jgi:hypothetical protein
MRSDVGQDRILDIGRSVGDDDAAPIFRALGGG